MQQFFKPCSKFNLCSNIGEYVLGMGEVGLLEHWRDILEHFTAILDKMAYLLEQTAIILENHDKPLFSHRLSSS